MEQHKQEAPFWAQWFTSADDKPSVVVYGTFRANRGVMEGYASLIVSSPERGTALLVNGVHLRQDGEDLLLNTAGVTVLAITFESALTTLTVALSNHAVILDRRSRVTTEVRRAVHNLFVRKYYPLLTDWAEWVNFGLN